MMMMMMMMMLMIIVCIVTIETTHMFLFRKHVILIYIYKPTIDFSNRYIDNAML